MPIWNGGPTLDSAFSYVHEQSESSKSLDESALGIPLESPGILVERSRTITDRVVVGNNNYQNVLPTLVSSMSIDGQYYYQSTSFGSPRAEDYWKHNFIESISFHPLFLPKKLEFVGGAEYSYFVGKPLDLWSSRSPGMSYQDLADKPGAVVAVKAGPTFFLERERT